MKTPIVLTTFCALAIVASAARSQQSDWVGANDPSLANSTTQQQVLRPSPDPQFTNGTISGGTTVYRANESVAQAPAAACCNTTTTVLSPVVETAPVTVYRPSTVTYYSPPVTYYSPPVTVYRPAPVTYYRPAPVTVYSPVVGTTVYSPVVPATVYSPVVVGRPVVVRSKVYVPGQPVRNFFKAITP